MTRGFFAILRLDFSTAWRCNFLSIPLFFGIALYFIFGITDAVAETRLVAITEALIKKKFLLPLYTALWLASFWVNNLP